MKQGQFEQRYRETWTRFEDLLGQLESNSAWFRLKNAEEYGQLYRRICHFHSIAQERNYSSFLVDHLGDMVVRGHQYLYRRHNHFLNKFIQFFVADFPRLVRQEQRWFWFATAVFYLPTLLIALAVLIKPELVYTVMDSAQVSNMEEMYNPENRTLGSAREAETNWHMFGFYIYNNIGVSFRTFASGILWGIGSLFFLIYNGLLFGAVSAHMINVEYVTTFFTFVVAHGSFELTAIVISGAAGFKLGWSLLFPGNLSRKESLLNAAEIAIKLVYGVIGMLFVAAFIEAFWSSNNAFYPWQKYMVGGVLWFVVIVYLTLGGRKFGSQ